MPIDLSSFGGPGEGWIIDSLFQEVDIETGELLFQWRASDHVPIDDTMLVLNGNGARTPEDALDYFHINSVDKDGEGNYIISGRHTHSVICISAEGNTRWVLGGRGNMFRDLSGGRTTDFSWQHQARVVGNNTLLSIFDNGMSEERDHVAKYSRAMVVELDMDSMTTSLVREFADPRHSRLAKSQGSAQALEHSGNMLVGYGFLPIFTEFGEDGEVLCDVHIAPRIISKLGMVTSYRVFKSTTWVGRPIQPPNVFLRPSEGKLYVSWHGATEIDRWALEGADWEGVKRGDYARIFDKKKDAFEVSFTIRKNMLPYLRVIALDKNNEVLGRTEVISRETGNAPSTKLRDGLVWVGLLLIPVIVVMVLRRRIRRILKSLLAIKPVRSVLKGEWWQDRRAAKPHEIQPLYTG